MADVKKIKVQIGADTRELDAGMQKAQSSVNSFGKTISKIGGMMGAAFSVAVVARFAKSTLQLANIQQRAETQLLTALKGRKNVQQALIEQAAKLQKVTLYGDEETIRAQSLIAAFVKEEETIKRIIPLVQDMATAKGMDLAGAADLVSKTLGSSTNAMSRYGIEVTGAVGSTERLTTLVDGLSNAFEGQAQAVAMADMEFKQLQNRWGDIKEKVGVGLMKSIVGVSDALSAKFTPAQWMANEASKAAAEALQEQADQMNRMANAEERMNRLSNMKAGWRAKQEEYVKLMATVKKPDKWGEEPGFVDWFSSEKIGGLDWSQDPVTEQMKARSDMMEHMNEQVAGWEKMWAEAFAEVEAGTEKVDGEVSKLGYAVGVTLATQFANLGTAIGTAMSGAEGSVKALGTAIMENIGSLLVMIGSTMGPAGLPFVIAGAAIQLGSGIRQGMGNGSSSSGSAMSLSIAGDNIVGTTTRYNSFKNIVT